MAMQLIIKSLFMISFLTAIQPQAQDAPHALHLSRCMMEYNSGAQALQMSMHIFLDDLEEALRLDGVDGLYLCTDKESEDANQHLQAYLEKNFVVVIDGQQHAFNFIGKEVSDDLLGVWCYLEIPNLQPMGELSIEYNVLMELYDDQKNIVHIKGPNSKKGTIFFRGRKTRETVIFK